MTAGFFAFCTLLVLRLATPEHITQLQVHYSLVYIDAYMLFAYKTFAQDTLPICEVGVVAHSRNVRLRLHIFQWASSYHPQGFGSPGEIRTLK